MSSFGYRLFTIEVFNGRRQRPVNFKDCNGEHFTQVADRLLKSLSTETMVGVPKVNGSVEGGEAELEGDRERSYDAPAFRVSDDVVVIDRTVRGSVWTGRFGSHQRALGAGDPSQDTDIRDKAASRNFRFIFALPEDGAIGVLAMEDLGRSCPVSPTIGWMRWRSQAEAAQMRSINYPEWRIRVCPITDEEHLDRMIKQGRVEKLELVKHSISGARTRDSERFRVSARIVNDSMVAQVSQTIKGWAQREKVEEQGTEEPADLRDRDGQAARQLAAIVGPEIVELGFDDGWVVVEDPFERTKRISPSRMSDIFTYEQHRERRFDTPEFYAEVRRTAMRLQAAHKINIEWPLG